MIYRKPLLLVLPLVLSLMQAQQLQVYSYSAAPAVTVNILPERLIRTELYFGRNKSDGTTVSDEEWRKFLANFVTPRFPDGFTIVDGMGQFRGKDGVIVREASKVIVIMYSKKNRRQSDAKIEEIRAEYRKRFSQESVLRVDFSKNLDVFF